ncbi:MerR family transcriptional regulator [Aeromicrobium sp. YIM 150415]|uniref:MerR family transcriptional regulator n=1 Tax=Aeromicrobium sp. YIM 150415 TaxID=2803912 RepID=UPI001964D2E9|nr:MerR family transcriptional regulator [Aeromicrobium sp. YIM 150415]MBM9464357.1 MerR family transcriptional regulator [Aeromicrobium sp. YIM 150415]
MSSDTDLRVGEVATRSGLTVRALHHYDRLGLVRPSARTAGGHRLYDAADLERLYVVVGLREMGLSLDRIGEVVSGALTVAETLEHQRAALDAQIVALTRARDRVVHAQRAGGELDLLALIKEVVMSNTFEQYFDADQIAQLQRRRAEIGEQRIAEVENAWPELMARVDAAIAQGTDPGSEEGRALAGEWSALLEQFHGGDEGLKNSLFRMYEENQPTIEDEWSGPSQAQLDFITAAQR